MSLLIQYLVKLSISLSIVWLFYQFILRRLTFYNSNRWYLLGYTLLSFFIPFINISSLIGNTGGTENRIIQFIPSVHQYTTALEEASHCPIPIWSTQYDKWDWTAFALMIGAAILLLRFIIRYISFVRIRHRSELISGDGIKIYQVDKEIIPFSFGNAVFINRNQHSEEELKEIVRHEFVHVKQNHTIDIVWAELLCIFNWYNPFAWLLKRSIRQNLEFIADNKVIENGINKKEYQYLLLKVIGNRQFCIATQFNFSSLKKRIAMMNKTKSAKLQVGRFLFLFPLLAIILLAFRNSFNDSTNAKTNNQMAILTDTIPNVKILNSKGYYIDIKDNKGNCMVVIKDKNKKEVKRLLLTEWNEKDDYYEHLYGEILSPTTAIVEEKIKANNPAITTVTVNGNTATVTLKNGKTEVYTLSLKDQKKAFEERCGTKEVAVSEISLSEIEEPGEIKEVTIAEVPVKVTTAELAETVVTGVPLKKAVSTTGEIKEVAVVGKPLTKTIVTDHDLQAITVTGVPLKKAVSTTGEIKEVTVVGKPAKTITTDPEVTNNEVNSETEINTGNGNGVGNGNGNGIGIGEEEILVTITNKTTREELESFVKKMKEKGYELKFTNKNYNDGVIKQISGTVRYKDNNSAFSATDFSKLTISTYRDGDKIQFKIVIRTIKGVS